MTSRRITLVTNELRGSRPVGGIGTGTTFLALALARMGHDVEILHFGTPPTRAIDPEWGRIYASAGIRVRFVSGSDETVEPRYFARMPETADALRADPPDILITQDTAAPAYVALRLRQLGLGFENTLFVVVCYGTRLWIKDVSRMVRVFPYLLGVSALEGASLELADIVVSPSKYVVEWMQQQGWRLPSRTLVIPYLSRSAATGEQQPRTAVADGRVERIAFFGRLEERKGLKPFAAGLNALEPELLQRIELEFLGAPTRAWPPERITALLSDTARAALRRISFATDLDQPEVLERLGRAGTLAVMPSLGETFGNAVYECLERGIPFIASNAGATPELIAPDDHRRVLFEPTAKGVAVALRCALSDADALRPARPAFDAHGAYERWAEVVGSAQPPRRQPAAGRPAVDVVVVRRGAEDELARCLSALRRQNYPNINVTVVDSGEREAGLEAGAAPYVVFLDEQDEPAEDFVATLVHAQAVSGADVVTSGLRLRSSPRQHLFLGDPGGLGLLSNSYGTPALIRRSLIDGLGTPWPVEGDSDWPLLAGLHLAGAHIVSIPMPLLTRTDPPGSLEQHPADALLVLGRHEQALPGQLRPLARLAAGLAAGDAQGSVAPTDGRGIRQLAQRVRRHLGR
ncbi:MAG: glycosyltransferase [Actinobacteria bacterium]|nr:MAG: glycosyltransferase [Actinomycetota bacterium]